MYQLSLSHTISTQSVLAIGNFDGVHLGHQALLSEARRMADEAQCALHVLTFFPHPKRFFSPDKQPLALTKLHQKCDLFATLGVDMLVLKRFNTAFASMEATDFIHWCQSTLGAQHIVTGAGFRFGAKRTGDAQLLKQVMGSDYRAVTPLLAANGKPYASSTIRHALLEGKLDDAAHQLGRPYSISGRVMHGDKRGRMLGYPTANLSLHGLHLPKFGVYAGWVDVKNRHPVPEYEVRGLSAVSEENTRYKAAINIGIRPMFDSDAPLIEAHLLDYSGSLYGQRIEVELHHYLREEQRFDGLQALTRQMGEDVTMTEQNLSSSRPPEKAQRMQ